MTGVMIFILATPKKFSAGESASEMMRFFSAQIEGGNIYEVQMV